MGAVGVLPELFDALFDDAAVFPPGDAPLPVALADHSVHRRSWYRRFIGPLVLPTLLAPDVSGEAIEVALTGRLDDPDLPQQLQRVATNPILSVRALELATSHAGSQLAEVARLAEPFPDATTYVEFAPGGPTEEHLDAVSAFSERPLRAKLRTGGLAAHAFPSEARLAAWIVACVERDVPFKCTAGLHHAVRNTAADSGFEHHGFLNVLAAVHAAQTRPEAAGLAELLAMRDAGAVVATINRLSPEAAAALRAAFVSFGTCSVTEPIDDLVALGLADAPTGSARRPPVT